MKVDIQGHASAHGSGQYNMVLSQKRAIKVRDYLIAKGIDPARMSTEYFGKDRPLEAEEKPTLKNTDTKASRANRRVTITPVK